MKTKNIYDQVKLILEEFPETRDSDKRLIWEFWIREGKTDYVYTEPQFITFYNFLSATSPESIRRSRQAIQLHHPQLRGEKYKLRKQMAAQPPVYLEPVQENMI